MNPCEFCGRSAYLNEGETCNGCGAPIHRTKEAYPPSFLYNPAALNWKGVQYLTQPGRNIPVNIPQRSKISDFIQAAATLGASMTGRR